MRKDVVLILWLACFFFGLKGHAQVVHQWQLNSFNWSEKPAYKPISSGEICRLNIQQDSLYLTLIDQEGATSFEKVYSELTSDPKFIEGFDDRTNACLAILYTNTNGWLNQFNLEVFYNADSTLFNIVKPTSNGAYWKPIDLYYDGKD